MQDKNQNWSLCCLSRFGNWHTGATKEDTGRLSFRCRGAIVVLEIAIPQAAGAKYDEPSVHCLQCELVAAWRH